MRMNIYILLLSIIIIAGCNEKNPVSPKPPDPPPPVYPNGIPNAKAFDNLQLIRSLEQQQRQDTVLIQIHSPGVTLNGIINNDVWVYRFAKIANNIETDYVWYVWYDGKIELNEIGPPIKPNEVAELISFLIINSQKAIKLARQYGAKDYMDRHPNAIVTINYVWQWTIPTITMQFWIPNAPTGCEPQWWIRSDTGELLYTDYQLCNEN